MKQLVPGPRVTASLCPLQGNCKLIAHGCSLAHHQDSRLPHDHFKRVPSAISKANLFLPTNPYCNKGLMWVGSLLSFPLHSSAHRLPRTKAALADDCGWSGVAPVDSWLTWLWATVSRLWASPSYPSGLLSLAPACHLPYPILEA